MGSIASRAMPAYVPPDGPPPEPPTGVAPPLGDGLLLGGGDIGTPVTEGLGVG